VLSEDLDEALGDADALLAMGADPFEWGDFRGRRRRRDALALPTDSRIAADSTRDLSRLVKRELRSRIAHLVGALPAEQREALRLRYVEGLSRAEIAYVLDLPEGAVKSRLFEGLKKLREHAPLLEGR
jgi:RNA polymerase sigma factor (sigma-70 family)